VLGPKLAQQIEQRPRLGDLPGVAVVDDQVEGAPGQREAHLGAF
jgi:hypothetical protein